MTYSNNLALLPPLSGESLVHSFAQGHRFARISASINLQPLQLGLDKDLTVEVDTRTKCRTRPGRIAGGVFILCSIVNYIIVKYIYTCE